MTNYLMSNESFIVPSVYKPRLNNRVFLYSKDSEEGNELVNQIGYFGYQVQLFDQEEDLKAALRWSMPNALLFFIGAGESNFSDFESISQGIQNQVNNLPVVVISPVEDFSIRLKVVRTGGSAFFTHPVDISALIGALDEISNPNASLPFRILIVEDALTQASYYAMHLEKVGMETRIVTEPSRMMQPLNDFNPDLILLDMYMPDCTGIELAQMIRQMENFMSVPIVFLSAETDKERQLAALMMGGDDFLIKPIKPEHLIASITSRVERYRKLRSMMTSDGLTGLLNHTVIKERLVNEVHRAKREKQPVSFAMIDLDHFKEVNDRYGHALGDRVLKSLARLLKQRLRRTDLIGRYGGEEFAMILPNTSAVEAVSVIDKLRDGFSKLHQHSGETTFTVTFSGGVASYPDYKTPAAISQAADKALYEAKRRGRNRVLQAEG